MKRTLAAACAALLSLSASAAFAQEAITVKLQKPVTAESKIIAGGAVFVCNADSCVAGTPVSETFGVVTCKELTRRVGPVVSFAGYRPLSADELGRCNASAKK